MVTIHRKKTSEPTILIHLFTQFCSMSALFVTCKKHVKLVQISTLSVSIFGHHSSMAINYF